MPSLFDSLQVGRLVLPNRVVMAPLTRCRAAQPGDVPTALMAEYYAQRASAGLIISEATWIEPQAKGYLWTPGIFSAAQRDAWRQVTDAVHAAGGRIVCQLWHVGRVSHGSVLPEGMVPVSSVATEHDAHTFALDADGKPGRARCTPCRALAFEEVLALPGAYGLAAAHAIDAGFDGVEIHAANGYLLEQFLNGVLNTRDDAYGGSIENRCRLVLQVIDEVVRMIGGDRTGIRLSPHGQGIGPRPDPEWEPLSLRLMRNLSARRVAFVHINDHTAKTIDSPHRELWRAMRKEFGGPCMVCGGYTPETAERELADGIADAVVFGKPFISNPDLVERLQRGVERAPWDQATFYGGDHRGYTDYPRAT
jgi:N-ethylmaleimide reductase